MLVLCPSYVYGVLDLSFTGEKGGGVAFPLHHGGVFALKGSAPLSSVLFSWDGRGTSSTTSTVTECVKRVRRLFHFLVYGSSYP